jgi:LL-diaminopimelate aminotransferase
MTGWRCGWAAGSREVCSVLSRVKSFVDTGAYMGIQYAGVAAIESWASFLPGNLAVFRERRDAAVAAFREAGFACESPRATMYLWIPLPEGVPSAAFAGRLMDEEGVIVLPSVRRRRRRILPRVVHHLAGAARRRRSCRRVLAKSLLASAAT